MFKNKWFIEDDSWPLAGGSAAAATGAVLLLSAVSPQRLVLHDLEGCTGEIFSGAEPIASDHIDNPIFSYITPENVFPSGDWAWLTVYPLKGVRRVDCFVSSLLEFPPCRVPGKAAAHAPHRGTS